MENKIISFKRFILYKNCFSTSVQAYFCPCYCKLQSFNKHQRTKNTFQIALRQQTELPHPLLRSSSLKTVTIVREQRYTRIKYTCKANHLQKIKLLGGGQKYPLMETPPPFLAFHWSPHGSLVSIGQHFVTMRVVHLPKRTETSLITESDRSRPSWSAFRNHEGSTFTEKDRNKLNYRIGPKQT